MSAGASRNSRLTRGAWLIYAAVAAALAMVGIANWLWTITLRGPVLYGEGAVAHAAILARERLEYTAGASASAGDALRPIFTAANYPPLFLHLSAIGDPFVTGRLISIGAALFVAAAIAWRARPAGWLVAATLALAWIGSVPVMQWGTALKPDLLALGLTVAAVTALDGARPRHALAGVLIAAAVIAKPTALLPAAAIFIFVARRSPLDAFRGTLAGLATAVVIGLITVGPDKAMRLHVIDWNALPWRLELATALMLIALIVLAVPIVAVVVTRPSATVVSAYVAAAIGVVLLGGREGATINYFLDLSAGVALALAGRAPILARSPRYPFAASVHAVLVFALLNPLVGVPSLLQPTGKWGDPYRIAYVQSFVTGTVLIEDSGLLIANGREPLVDDLFLWSRNREREKIQGLSFFEGERLLQAVREGTFDLVVSEVDLERMDAAPGFERQRWHPDLVVAVLGRYERRMPFTEGLCVGGVWCQRLFVYARRAR